MTYKIRLKDGEEVFIDATVAEIKSPIFEKLWEVMEFESVEKYSEVEAEEDEEDAQEDLLDDNIELI